MKVYLSVDMEGVAGVTHPRTTEQGEYGYAEAAELMTREASAAVDGAFMGGATEVLVNDAHGKMLNLSPLELDSRARLLQGQKTWSALEGGGPDEGHEVGLFVGSHARAGEPRGTISHTYSHTITATKLNGRPVGETGLHAAVLGEWGVPIGLVSGDDMVAEETREWLPWSERVVVKHARGRHAAVSVHPSIACELIRDGAQTAVRRGADGELQPLVLDAPVTLEVEYAHPGQADYAGFVPGVERAGERGIRIEARSAVEAYRCFLCGVRLVALVA